MKKITPELFREYKIPSGVTLSPEATKAAFVLQTADNDADGYKTNLWLYNNEKIVQLTNTDKDGLFIWDDEETILLAGNRKDGDKKKAEEGDEFTIFHRLSLAGGEALEAFRIPVRVIQIEKIEQGKYMVLAKCDANVPDYYKMSGEERKQVADEKKKNADFNILDEAPFWFNGITGFTNKIRTRLFVFDESTKTLTPGSTPLFEVGSTTIIGDEIYYCGQEITTKQVLPQDVYCYNILTKEIRLVYKGEKFNNRHQEIAKIGDELVFIAATDEKYGQNTHPDFWTMDKQTGELSLLTEADYSFGNLKQRDGQLMFNGQARISTNLYQVNKEGITCAFEWNGQITSFDTQNGKTIITGKVGTGLDEVYLVEGNKATQVSSFNTELINNHYVGECELITIPSHTWDIDGWVIKPIDYDPNKKYPAILTIHGGPKGAYRGIYSHDMQLWASAGYFVFFCNPFGGDGRGNEFAEIREKHGTVDYEDIMNFTDEVLKRYPQIDEKRMGVTGISYGGYMTNWIIGHTHRFSAASSNCSVVNWVSLYGVSDISRTFVPDQMGGTIWDSIGTYWDHSPLKYANQVTTPTLFIQPLEDYRCHLSEGLQMVTALIDNDVETRVCTFKGDSHGLNSLGKPSHRERSFRETLNWMDSHLK